LDSYKILWAELRVLRVGLQLINKDPARKSSRAGLVDTWVDLKF
jgi:hypothetical protein